MSAKKMPTSASKMGMPTPAAMPMMAPVLRPLVFAGAGLVDADGEDEELELADAAPSVTTVTEAEPPGGADPIVIVERTAEGWTTVWTAEVRTVVTPLLVTVATCWTVVVCVTGVAGDVAATPAAKRNLSKDIASGEFESEQY